jgi:hypothetical protein
VNGGPVFLGYERSATSHSLAEYRRRGGYLALEKALRTLIRRRSSARSCSPACRDAVAPASRPA